MLKKILLKLGLNEKEAKIYLAALELGETSIQRISDKSKVKRTTTYDILESLKKRGLISTTRKGKRTFYFAENPHALKDDLIEKQNLLEQALPEFLSIANFIDNKPKIKFYEGIEGIKEVYLDSLNYPKQEILAWIAEEAFYNFDQDFVNHYIGQRVKKNIWIKTIASDDPAVRKYKEKDEKSLRTTKLWDEKTFPLDVEVDIYGNDKIGIMSFEENFGLIIESKKIHKTLKSMFQFAWKNLK